MGGMVFCMGPAFNRIWASSIVSNLSDGVLAAAAPLLAISLTDSPVLISAIGATVMLPWLLFAIPIGALVDRIDRRFILAAANAFRSGVVGVLALAIALDIVTIYWLLVAGFIIGICEVAADTTAQSLIPQILEEKDYEKGNSRLQISETVIQGFVGAPISGFIYAAAIYLPFLINSLGFAVASLFALSIPIKYLQDVRVADAKKEPSHFVADMKFGIAYLFNQKVLRRLVVTTASIGLCYSMATSTMVLFVIKELGLQERYFGVTMAIQGVGAIVGSLVASRASNKFGRSTVMAYAIVASSVLVLIEGFSPNIYIFVALATIGGFVISQWNILLMATYQTVIPQEFYGRIHGTRRTLVWGTMPFGALLGGVLAKVSLRLPMYVGGAIATIIAISSITFLLKLGENSRSENMS
jgi:MFS family permease